MKTAVVILNWNGRHMLERFLPSVTSNTTGDAEVIIADNGSTDDSLAFLAEHYPALRVIALDKNYGFAGGYNKALAQVEADYFVLLNDDVEVPPHWVEPVIAQMEANPLTAICQPKLLMYDQRDTFEYAGGAGGFIDKYGYPFCRGRLFTTLEQDHGQYNDPCEIFWASGAAMFVRSDVWRQLGGLDADFFAHMEEIDFCWRVKNHDYKVMYCPQSKVYHIGGGTLPKSSARKTYLNFRNNLSLLMKNLPKGAVFFTIAYRILLDWVAGIKFLFDGCFADVWAVTRAHLSFYRHLPILRKKRRELPHKKVSMVYQKNIVFKHFLEKKKLYTELNEKDFS